MIIIPLGNNTRAEVISSVIGQLSDGIWENSGAMKKYWMYANVNGTNLEVDDEKIDRAPNGFRGMTEEKVRDWFANKAKQVVKIYFEDYHIPSNHWKRDNSEDIIDYMGGHRVPEISVADVYECYDYLKQRKGKYNYGKEGADISASEEINQMNEETLFTAAAVLDLLRQIDELSDKDIDVFDNESFALITIGDSQYRIDYNQADSVEVPEAAVDEVTDIIEDTYDELGASGVEYEEVNDIQVDENGDLDVVEGGLIKETLKTLLVGGLVRLTGKLVGDDVKGK
jgi:hypothetical protein